jgi:hypothetical protein
VENVLNVLLIEFPRRLNASETLSATKIEKFIMLMMNVRNAQIIPARRDSNQSVVMKCATRINSLH